jgi:hypothetical protein
LIDVVCSLQMKPPKDSGPSKRATVEQQVEGLVVFKQGGREALSELIQKNKEAYDKGKAEHEKKNPSKTE